MQVSRLFLGALTGVAGLAACGGGGGAKLLDAAPDSPPDAFVCAQKGTLTGNQVLDFATGGGQAEGAAPMVTTANPTPQLTVEAVVTTTTARDRGFLIVQVNNGGMYSPDVGKAQRFENPPVVGSYPMDTDNDVGFVIDFVNGISSNADSTVNIDATQVQLLDDSPGAGGTVHLDSWDTLATPGGFTLIGATITNAKFKGYNVLPGTTGQVDPAGNGCDITLTTLTFTNLKVHWQTTPFPQNVAAAPPRPPGPPGPPAFSVRTLLGAAVLGTGALAPAAE
jgi:hypothetical protein